MTRLRKALSLEAWPAWLLVVVGLVCVATNVPPLERLSVWHLLVASMAALGFGSALVAKRRQRSNV